MPQDRQSRRRKVQWVFQTDFSFVTSEMHNNIIVMVTVLPVTGEFQVLV